jgi:hypothetical protein
MNDDSLAFLDRLASTWEEVAKPTAEPEGHDHGILFAVGELRTALDIIRGTRRPTVPDPNLPEWMAYCCKVCHELMTPGPGVLPGDGGCPAGCGNPRKDTPAALVNELFQLGMFAGANLARDRLAATAEWRSRAEGTGARVRAVLAGRVGPADHLPTPLRGADPAVVATAAPVSMLDDPPSPYEQTR